MCTTALSKDVYFPQYNLRILAPSKLRKCLKNNLSFLGGIDYFPNSVKNPKQKNTQQFALIRYEYMICKCYMAWSREVWKAKVDKKSIF